MLLLLLSLGCTSHRLQALEAENLRLRQDLATANTQLTLLRAQGCGAGGVTGGVIGPPAQRANPADQAEQARREAEATLKLQEARVLDEGGAILEARERYQALTEQWSGTRAATSALRRLQELAVIGKAAPALEVARWLVGEAPAASPVQVLVFWEIWCPHCQRELPELSRKAEDWRRRGITLVGLTRLTRSATEERVLAFYAENHISFPTALEQERSLSDAYVVSGIPAAVVIKEGVVVWRGHPARLSEELLQKVGGR